MSNTGGKIKASDALLATSGTLGIAAGASAPILGVDAVATPLLGAASGITFGVSRVLKAFGAGLPQDIRDKLQEIKTRHEKPRKRKIAKKILNRDMSFINDVFEKHKHLLPKPKEKGAGLSTGGQLKTGGSVKMHKMKIGSKRQVWNGTAEKTSGGLRKSDLIKNTRGRIVSKRKSELGRKRFKEGKLKITPKTKEQLAQLKK